jgi:8-oxo-dGTP pyrophosphatase MutT (NUDIX family)
MPALSFDDILKPEEPSEKEITGFTIYKADEDKHLVFGWASVVLTVNGEELEDRQHDMIDPEDLEDAAYEYVLNFRDTGEEHLPGYRKKGKLVESVVLTKEKQKAMGIPDGILPVGWWIGFKIDDEDTWQRVKNGTYKMFSIEGKAQREPVKKARRNFEDFPGYWEWLEENLDASKEDQKTAEKYYGGKTHLKKADQPTGCGVLVIRDGKILTGTRNEMSSYGQICGPGGHIEEGETPEEAAKRETFEEFGITCNDLQPLGIQDGGDHGTSAVFLCTDYEGTPKTDEEEMTDLQWRTIGELKDAEMFLPFAQSLELLPERKTVAKSFLDILKFNPYHDRIGRFTGAGGGAGGPVAFFTNRTKDPAKQHWADKARLREQERQVKILEGKVDEAKAHANKVMTDPNASEKEMNEALSEWKKRMDELVATKKPLDIKSPEKQEPKKPETAPKEYKTPTRSEVHEMAKEMGNSRSDISPEDYEIMAGENNWGGRYFQSGNAFLLNKALRKAPDGDLSRLSDSDKKLVETLDKNMKPSTRDIKVTRMVGDSFLRDQLGLRLDNEGNVDESSLKNAVGKVTVCKSYSSTSYDMGENVFKSRNVKLNINAPKGSKMLVSPTGEEAEILLARNTAFHVKGIRQTGMKWGEPQYEIDVDILVD